MLFGDNNTVILYTTPIPNGTDPITGEPSFTNGVVQSWDLSLEQKDTKGLVAPNAGINSTQIYLEGRALFLPSWYATGGYYKIIYRYGSSPVDIITGRFYTMPVVSSRFGLESVFGYAVNGILVADGTSA